MLGEGLHAQCLHISWMESDTHGCLWLWPILVSSLQHYLSEFIGEANPRRVRIQPIFLDHILESHDE